MCQKKIPAKHFITARGHFSLKAGFYKALIFFLTLPPALYPQYQNIKFEHITVEQGLSSNRVTSILQDSQGFMWFGTENGLHKYDGYTFTIYKPDPVDPGSISHVFIYSIFKDAREDLWIGTYGGGLNKFERDKEKFIRYQNDPDDPHSLSNNFVAAICQSPADSGKALWIGTRWGGLNKLDLETARFHHYLTDRGKIPEVNTNSILSICCDNNGTLWIATEASGLISLDPQTEQYAHHRADPVDKSGLCDNKIRRVFTDKSNNIWIGTDAGLNRFDMHTNEFSRFVNSAGNGNSLSHNQVLAIHEDRQGHLWVGTFNGLNLYSKKTGEFIRFNSEQNKPNSLSHDYITKIYEDRSGLLWIATHGGINRINPAAKKFNHVQIELEDSDKASINSVRCMQEDSEDSKILWLGTTGSGLIRYNRNSREFEQVIGHNETVFVRSLYQAPLIPGKIWLATWGSGLIRIDKDLKQSSRKVFWLDNSELKDANHISSIYPLSKDNVLLGTGLGLYQFDLVTGEHFGLMPGADDPYSLSHPNVTAICRDRSGQLWVGTYGGGLNKLVLPPGGIDLKKTAAKFVHYKHNPDNPRSLSSSTITLIHEAQNGIIWVGTLDGGLNKLVSTTHGDSDKVVEGFIRYTERDGLPSNAILGVLEDNSGNLWISTKNGLSMFDPVDGSFHNFRKSDGLQSNEFNRFAYFRNDRGELYFGGINGFNHFKPAVINKNPVVPNVVITDFRIFNQSVRKHPEWTLNEPVSETDAITLTHDQSVFTFEFAALEYTNSAKNTYAYKMEGIDPRWVYTDASRRFATYTHLDPGEYLFSVRASNNDGVWNQEGTSVRIIIAPPWWRTTTAYLIYFLAGIGLIFSLRRYELNRQKLKYDLELEHIEAEKFKEVDRMKSRFFANISHEFRTPLTLITGPVERLLSQVEGGKIKEDLSRIKDNAHRMNNLVDMYLDLSRLESGNLTLQKVELDILPSVKNVIASFRSLAESARLKLVFETSVGSAVCNVDREKFELILINLLSNAIKFTPPEGTVKICINAAPGDKLLDISFTDTGIGIPDNELDTIFDMYYQVENEINKRISGTGIGLAMVKELIKLHAGEISAESIVGKGSTFTLTIPMIRVRKVISKEMITSAGRMDKTSALSERYNPAIKRRDQRLILIVEDDHQMLEYINSHVAEYYLTRLASSGQDGFEAALVWDPALIISDVMMPEMDGYELCKKLKEDFRTSHIPLILLTARTGDPDMLRGLEQGADNYLKKPFKANELLIRINNLIENRRRLHRKFRTERKMDLGELQITSADESFLQKCYQIAEKQLSNPAYSVDQFSGDLAISRVQLHRKLKALTGLSAGHFIKIIRLKKAAALLETGTGNISEIAYDCGFSNPAYFAKSFRAAYNLSPTQYLQKAKM